MEPRAVGWGSPRGLLLRVGSGPAVRGLWRCQSSHATCTEVARCLLRLRWEVLRAVPHPLPSQHRWAVSHGHASCGLMSRG